nr:hypothetical protein [Novosphingobium panipatense]
MVNLFVAITDRSWFELLSQEWPDEVNFWQPSGNRNFGAVSVGELFLFKLHAPDDFIVGGGIFSHASNVPLSLAWGVNRRANGTPDRRAKGTPFQGCHDGRGTRLALRAA